LRPFVLQGDDPLIFQRCTCWFLLSAGV